MSIQTCDRDRCWLALSIGTASVFPRGAGRRSGGRPGCREASSEVRHREGAVPGSGRRAGHDRRVLRLRVPVLGAERPDHAAPARAVSDPGALGVEAVPAEVPQEGAPRPRGRAGRGRAGTVLRDVPAHLPESGPSSSARISTGTRGSWAWTWRASRKRSTTATSVGRVVSDILEARRLGVFATPTLFVNGHRIMGAKVAAGAARPRRVRSSAAGSGGAATYR